MPRGPLSGESGGGLKLGAGIVIPDVKAPDVRLLSVWATIAAVCALAVLWRLVHHCFQLGVLARSPKLGRLKSSEGRSPRVLAGHFTAVANVAVCIAAYLPAARQRLAADAWSPGALLPLWSRPLAIGPPLPGTSTFYLSLAGYCLHAALLAAERLASGVSSERMVLLQRTLLFLLAASICMVEWVPELALALLLLEVPSPFVALWQALQDFRLRSDPLFSVSGVVAVTSILKLRLIIFGLCLVCAVSHPEVRQKLWGDGHRFLALLACIALFTSYAVHVSRLYRDLRREWLDARDAPQKV